jgi:hypothetical protein
LEREEGGEEDNGIEGQGIPSFDEDDYDSIFMDMLDSQPATDSPAFSQGMDTSGG